jgi:hypothetical protein
MNFEKETKKAKSSKKGKKTLNFLPLFALSVSYPNRHLGID